MIGVEHGQSMWAVFASGCALVAVLFIPVALGNWRELKSAFKDVTRKLP